MWKNFDTAPAFKINKGKTEKGYDVLALKIKSAVSESLRVLMIDGYHGIKWDEFSVGLKNELEKIKVHAHGTQTAYSLVLFFELLNKEDENNVVGLLIDDIKQRGWHISTGL